MTVARKCPAQSPLQKLRSLLESTYSLTLTSTSLCFGSDDITTRFLATLMADHIFYYIQTWLTPLLVLTVSLCILRYCCKICSKVSDTDSDLDLSNSDHIYVIPNPIHMREERDEQDDTNSHDNSEFTPPPYEQVCPPPSYSESSFKLNISDVRVTPDSEIDTSDMPPPPYSPPLPMMSYSSSHRQ